MPVRFRCTECASRLSIARRKIGTAVTCPNCGRVLTVPTENMPREKLTKLVVAGPAGTTEQVGAPLFPVSVAKPSKPTAPVDLEDMPLFERSDFERMLEPAVREAHETMKQSDRPEILTTPSARPPDGILIMRSTATMLTAAMVVLIGLAFAAGFLVGRR